MQTELSGIASARVVLDADSDNAKAAANKFRTRTVLSGTRRKTNRGMQISVQLLDPDGESLFGRIVDPSATSSDLKSFAHDLAPQIYSILVANDWSTLIASKRDPALRNERSRNLILAGRELIERRGVDDIDRAIACLRKASEMVPDSALARAYLASAAATRTHFEYDAKSR